MKIHFLQKWFKLMLGKSALIFSVAFQKMKLKSNKNIYNNCCLKVILFICLGHFSTLIIAQSLPNNCEIDGKLLYSDCVVYKGNCKNNKANGWGDLYLDNGNILSGLFSENQIQNFYLEYYFAEKNRNDYGLKNYSPCYLVIGPNKGGALHGPCMQISDNAASMGNYDNGHAVGTGGTFQIPKPNFDMNSVFCDPAGYLAKDESYLIPNTNYIIYESDQEYNNIGLRKYWLTVVDLSSNKIISTFGSADKPLTYNKAITFVGFTQDSKPIYNYLDKNYKLDIKSGIATPLLSIPVEILNEKKINERINTITYKDYPSLNDDNSNNKKQFKILHDGNYLKSFNSKAYLESCHLFRPQPGSGSSLIFFNTNNEIIKSLDLPNYNIYDFDVDENNQRIALLFGNKDSTYLSYLDLRTFARISNVFSKKGEFHGGINFSKTGIYLFHKVRSGSHVYLGNKLHYGLEGSVALLNDDENVAISNDGGAIWAYDLEKKTIIWSYYAEGDDINNMKFFKIDNKIYSISGRALSYEGFKVKESGIMLRCFTTPEPLFSITEFAKNPEVLISTINVQNETITNEKGKPTEAPYNLANMSNDDKIAVFFLAIRVYAAIFESSSHELSSSSRTSNSNNTSTSNANEKCPYCKPSDIKGWYIKDYDVDRKIYINGRYLKKIGHKPCSSCHGTGSCRAYNMCSQYDNSYICQQCKGDRWQECERCRGTGELK